jgi:hypothetical protein
MADADHVVERQFELGQGGGQAAGLVDPDRHGHRHALVGNHASIDPGRLDRLAQVLLVGLVGGDADLPDRQRLHPSLLQGIDQPVRQRVGQRPAGPSGRVVQHPAMLGHDPGEQVLRQNLQQVLHPPPAHQDQMATRGNQLAQPGHGRRIDPAIGGHRLVIAASHSEIAHGQAMSRQTTVFTSCG